MLQGWVVVVVAFAYIGFLFLVASYGDRRREILGSSRARLLIYPLSLAIYCTSWTFFGSVGVASRTGFDFLTIYIGPVLMVGLFYPLIIRIVRLAKGQNITSIADFIAARYGKSQAVAATVATIAIVGMIPYIALQLKAVSWSVETILAETVGGNAAARPLLGDIALFVALLMAAFAVLFGTRHTDATEHQDGLMLAIATELIVKLVAFLAVGVFVTFVLFPGPLDLFTQALAQPRTAAPLTQVPPLMAFVAMTVLSLFAILLLPRQFHVAVVENHGEIEIRRAAWMFPLYLLLINLFVVPIAIAGLLTFPAGGVDGDMFVLALPLKAHSEIFALIAFVGGLSAATAMVIMESVALAIMVSNDIVMPLVLKRQARLMEKPTDAGAELLTIRRIAIFAILLFAYVYYRSAGAAQLASIGFLSFAAIAQFAPAFFGGLIWRRGTALGAIAGMTGGILVWGYTLLLPSVSDAGMIGARILTDGPFGLALLRPASTVRPRSAAAGARRPAQPLRQFGAFYRRRVRAAPDRDRTRAGGRVRAVDARPDRAEFPAAPRRGQHRGIDLDHRPLSRRGAHPRIVRELRRVAAHQPRAAGRGRLPAAAIRRISVGVGDRRGVVAARAVAVAAPAHGVDQGRAQAPRRRQRRDPLQPRNPADRARSRAPGHRRVRQGFVAGLLEPAIRRNLRSAARPHPHRHRARRNSPPHRAAQRARHQRPRRRRSPNASAITPRRRSRSWNASPSAASSSRCARTACPTAAW